MIFTTIELFSGTGSFSKVATERGHYTRTIDNNPEMNPDLLCDMMRIAEIPAFYEIIWASPPCQCFSVASISKNWTGGKERYIPKTYKTIKALDLLDHTIKLISESKGKYYFIENPRGVMRKIIGPIFEKYGLHPKRYTVTYCQYGDTRMKPTDIWTNFTDWQPKPMCHNGDKCHEAAPRGSKTGTQGLKGAKERGVIPLALFHEIFEQIERSTPK